MTTRLEGVDYAFSWPDPVRLAAAGKRFAMRYIGPGTAEKHLSAMEREQIWGAGLAIVLLAEGAASSALGGYAVGRTHALQAQLAAHELGAPDDRPIYFALDWDVSWVQWPTAAAYLAGAASVIGKARVGVYGGLDAIEWAHGSGAAAWFFQTYAWSRKLVDGAYRVMWSRFNHVEQYQNGVSLAGGTVDLCRSVRTDYGQWTRKGNAMFSPEDEAAIRFTLLDGGERKPDHVRHQEHAQAFARLDNVLVGLADVLEQILTRVNEGGAGGITAAHAETIAHDAIGRSTIVPPTIVTQ